MKHLLKLSDWSQNEIVEILDLADSLKSQNKQGIRKPYLDGKALGIIFSKASTRTRVSFEVGIHQLGGYSMYLNGNDIQLNRGESISDTARVLSRYVDGIMIRTFSQQDVEMLAEYGTVPVINGLTDYCHPCQVLADLQTIREFKGQLKGLKLCFIGDGNNMANSLIVGCIKSGMEISIACPNNYKPDSDLISWGQENGKITVCDDIEKCAKNSDIVYTDVWASMGQECEKEERNSVFKKYQVNSQVMSFAKADAMILHCLPAHKGEEITTEVFEKHSNQIFEQAENRLHVQKAVMVKLMHNQFA